jgi:transcription elongation factor GreA
MVSMTFAAPVALTSEGMSRLHDDLLNLRVRRDSLTDTLAASPLDAGGSVLTEIALADRRISEIETVLERAQPLDENARVPGVVGISSRVTVHWDGDGEETYVIVDPAESAPIEGRISDESPVGQALLNQRVGDHVAVEVMGRESSLRILAVE